MFYTKKSVFFLFDLAILRIDKIEKKWYNIIKKGRGKPLINESEENTMMTKMIENWQNKVIRKYGFENWRTLLVFRLTRVIF